MTATVAIATSRAAPRASFTQPLTSRLDLSRVGEKAYVLSRLACLGMRVPNGFVITTAAMDSHLATNALSARLDDLCAALDTSRPDDFRAAADAARRIVTCAPIPERVLASVVDAAAPMLRAGPVIVRSSAVGEDSARGSFAGQLDSFLHVRTAEQLHRAVLDCWASYWSARALFYRVARGAPLRGMAIVVQHQVAASVAGVLFTRAGGDDVLVEYTFGLADALVAGRVNPGRFAIARRDRRVRTLAEPESRDARAERLLFGEEQIAGLVALAIDLERSLGGAQDVEWVMDHSGAIHLVQSRPITAPIALPVDAGEVVWSNANVNENFPAPISPLLYSIASAGYAQYFRGLASAFGISARRRCAMEPHFRQIIGVHGARMYYNLSSIHAVLRAAPFGEALASAFNRFVGAEATVPPPGPGDARVTRSWSQFGELCVVAIKTTRQYMQLGARVERFERRVDMLAARTTEEALSGMSLLELRDALRDVLDIRCHRWTDAALADAAAMVTYGALARLLASADDGGDRSRHNSLLRAIPDVVSSQPAQRLWALSRMVRSDPGLGKLFEREAPSDILQCVRRDAAFQSFNSALQAYLDDWGFRCSGELMLTVSTFQEEAAPIIDVIRTYARMDGASPADAMRAQEAERQRETRRTLEELRRVRLSPRVPFVTRARALRVVLPLTHAAIRYRERARLKQALLYSRCRSIALAIGKRLTERGTLNVAEQIFWLSAAEIDELLSGSTMLPHAVRDLALLRERAHAEECACVPPDQFTLAAGAYRDAFSERVADRNANGQGAHRTADMKGGLAAAGSETLDGVGACGGVVTARATVLGDVSEASRLARGDVLVTRQTDPGWGPVFFLIGGLVIERGGMLSHGAIIAREFGIPCVVGVKDATRRIPDGCTLSVDGGLGHARIVG